ncbi:MAG: hypothetical protein FJ077_03030 [Cyanobacteria bacterium K_DeepCast_35m_m2_023]|nr:hypothetical protein [Cyanobacteria bacterium K_DeepCast_35m_m2_023]
MAELLELVARAADLCLKPQRHGVRYRDQPANTGADCSDACVLIEARDAAGVRVPDADLELEIYRSGGELNLVLSWLLDDQAPMLWHGSHPVWMRGDTGLRCERPAGGAPLESLCRRLRALLDAGAATHLSRLD